MFSAGQQLRYQVCKSFKKIACSLAEDAEADHWKCIIESQMYLPPLGIVRERSVAHSLTTPGCNLPGCEPTEPSKDATYNHVILAIKVLDKENRNWSSKANENGYPHDSVNPDLCCAKERCRFLVALFGILAAG